MVVKLIQSAWSAWDEFFFQPMSLLKLGLFRMCLGFVLFLMYFFRVLDVKDFHFNAGFMPFELAENFYGESRKLLFYWFPNSDAFILVLHIVFLVGLLALCLGLLNRFSTFLLLLIHLALLQRNFAIMYGADLMASAFLFALCFCRHSEAFTLKKYFGFQTNTAGDYLSTIGIRFVQIQLCTTYAYTGLEKLRGSMWWDGTALWHVFGNRQLVPFDLGFMSNFPLVIGAMTFLTVIFEIYFPIMVWTRQFRGVWLSLGFIMHGLAGVGMSLYFFSLVMLASYILFLKDEEVEFFLKKIESRKFVRPL